MALQFWTELGIQIPRLAEYSTPWAISEGLEDRNPNHGLYHRALGAFRIATTLAEDSERMRLWSIGWAILWRAVLWGFGVGLLIGGMAPFAMMDSTTTRYTAEQIRQAPRVVGWRIGLATALIAAVLIAIRRRKQVFKAPGADGR